MIFDIKRFAINDGPGIRVTFFLKGCPLRCVWCHNPEGISPRPQLLFNQKKCIGCDTCLDVCQQHLDPRRDRNTSVDACLLCGNCAMSCPTSALELAGREWTIQDIMKVVEKERSVIDTSGGGVTICGGEPLMHPAETLAILRALGQHALHRCVDTTLYASEKVVHEVGNECELFLVDLKHMDSDMHLRYTGVRNEQILNNIMLVSQQAHPFWIRIPLIVGVNADVANLTASARFLASLPHKPEVVNLLVYHDAAIGKHDRIGSRFNPDNIDMRPPTDDEQHAALQIFLNEGLEAKIGG